MLSTSSLENNIYIKLEFQHSWFSCIRSVIVVCSPSFVTGDWIFWDAVLDIQGFCQILVVWVFPILHIRLADKRSLPTNKLLQTKDGL